MPLELNPSCGPHSEFHFKVFLEWSLALSATAAVCQLEQWRRFDICRPAVVGAAQIFSLLSAFSECRPTGIC